MIDKFDSLILHTSRHPDNTSVRIEVQVQNGYALTITLGELKELIGKQSGVHSQPIRETSHVPPPPTPPAKQSKSSRIKKRRGYRRSETNKLKYY
ncbi:MAG: hypothetical protein GY797_18150 [Deltaproteobacteria bacterium]|nr:hypothetical protein [Deltaproteobacteria bacterium]